MNTLNYRHSSRLLPLGLMVLMIIGLIFAPAAQAVRFISGGSGPGGGGEGDPLDANDYSDNGGLGGDDVHDGAGLLPPRAGGVIIQRPVSDGRVFIIIDFQGMIPVLRVIRVADSVVLLEGPHAR